MKFLDKVTLVLFSMIVLFISMIGIMIVSKLADLTTIYMIISNTLKNETACKIACGVFVVFILLALKAIFFSSVTKKEDFNDGILLENDDGKLLITKETLVSMVNAVVASFPSLKNNQTRVYLDDDNNLEVILTVETGSETIIKDISNNLQIKIKEKIKESLDLEVKSIDIKIKNIVDKKDNNQND